MSTIPLGPCRRVPPRRRPLQATIEREWKTHGDPEAETKAWAEKLLELERKRNKYQEMFAAEAMTLDELETKLEILKETRETAERENSRHWRVSVRGSKL
jgi:hypothetical protein